MKVRDQRINGVQFNTGVQENIGVAAAGLDLAIPGPDCFQGAAACGADSHHPVARRPRFVDGRSGLLLHAVPFGVHMVVLDFLLTDRAESAKPDMQRNLDNLDPLGADLRKQLRGKVQAGRRRGGAAKLLRIDRLVLALVLELFGDVGGQRHFAEGVKLFIQGLGVIGKGDKLVAFGQRLVHRGRQAAIAK